MKKPKKLKNTTPVTKIIWLDERREWQVAEVICLKQSCHHNWALNLPDVRNATAYLECPKCAGKKLMALRGEIHMIEFSPESANKMGLK